MNRMVRLLPIAKLEFDQGVNWLEEKQPGLGDDFMEAVSDALKAISSTPKIYREIYRGVRAVSLESFPYQIFYRLMGDDSIEVISVFHVRRNPNIWRNRISE